MRVNTKKEIHISLTYCSQIVKNQREGKNLRRNHEKKNTYSGPKKRIMKETM